jgi:uncharacterized protein YjbJ (UPF0337 family)
MNKDSVEGKAKDIAGRVERQVGEWTNDPKKQVDGTAKQVEGKVQHAWGKVKDAAQKSVDDAKSTAKPPQRVPDDSETEEPATTRKERR